MQVTYGPQSLRTLLVTVSPTTFSCLRHGVLPKWEGKSYLVSALPFVTPLGVGPQVVPLQNRRLNGRINVKRTRGQGTSALSTVVFRH